MSTNLSKCPKCGSDAADFQAATVCQDSWHTIPENAAAAAGEKARVEALAAGKTMAEAKAAEVRARRDVEGEDVEQGRRDAHADDVATAFELGYHAGQRAAGSPGTPSRLDERSVGDIYRLGFDDGARHATKGDDQ